MMSAARPPVTFAHAGGCCNKPSGKKLVQFPVKVQQAEESGVRRKLAPKLIELFGVG